LEQPPQIYFEVIKQSQVLKPILISWNKYKAFITQGIMINFQNLEMKGEALLYRRLWAIVHMLFQVRPLIVLREGVSNKILIDHLCLTLIWLRTKLSRILN